MAAEFTVTRLVSRRTKKIQVCVLINSIIVIFLDPKLPVEVNN